MLKLSAPDALEGLTLELVMSHLACADEPEHPMNRAQKATFDEMTAHPALTATPKSLAATGGVLLGEDFHYDLTRPGVGLYGGAPFTAASAVVRLEAPIVQLRDVAPGEAVGYGAAHPVSSGAKIATISVGYADGLIRAMSSGIMGWLGGVALPSAGRVSMDLITLDATGAPNASAIAT